MPAPAPELTINQRVTLAAIAGQGWCGKRLRAVSRDRIWWCGMAYFSGKSAEVFLKLRLIKKADVIRTARGGVYAVRFDITERGRALFASAAAAE